MDVYLGADDKEIAAVLPGDELVRTEALRTTRVVTIDAPIESVWPWMAQIGEDRGAAYGYSAPETLAVGTQIHNADTIHPEWQDVRVGDASGWPGDTARRRGRSWQPSIRIRAWC